MDQTELIQFAQYGDLEAFNQLVLTYQNRIFNTAVRLLGDEDSAADAAQNAFILAYRHLKNFRGGCFDSWLLRILKNVCYDELRRQKRQFTLPIEPVNDEGDEFDNSIWLADFSQDPAARVESTDLTQAIKTCLKALTPEYRMVLILVDIDGLDYTEAAAVIGVPIGTIKSRLARARLRLRRNLQNYADLLPGVYSQAKTMRVPERFDVGREFCMRRIMI